MSACLLLDPFQVYVEMSVVFGLSICMVIANSWELKFVTQIYFGGGDDTVSNCIGDESVFLTLCRKKFLCAGCFLQSRPISSISRVDFI